MNQTKLTVAENIRLTDKVYKMTLTGDVSDITAPGQFINIQLDGFFLRRPISVCDYDSTSVVIIYKTVGKGTEFMASVRPGAELDVLTGLGNGFDTSVSGKSPVLIGGGVGIPPMYALAKKLISENKQPSVIMGFNTANEIFYSSEFKNLGMPVYISTVNGEVGTKGFVTDIMKNLSYTYYYACGPLPMLRAVYDISPVPGQLSFEERMGCGFGACMGCSCKTKYGNKRICKDGPVLTSEEVIW